MLDTLVGRLAEQGVAWRGVFHSEPDDKVPAFADGAPALTVCLFGWTGGKQWPVFARSPEANDGLPDPLNRWSKRLLDCTAEALGAMAFYPFGGPPWLDFQRWALKAEPVHRSPLGLLIHPNGVFGTRTAERSACASVWNSPPAKARRIPARIVPAGRAFQPALSPPSPPSAPTITLPAVNIWRRARRIA
jgi:hypothetical protein